MPTLHEDSFRHILTAGGVESSPNTIGYIRMRSLSFPVIFTAFKVTLREKVQVLETFNEFIHVYAFGRAVGNANLSGVVLAQDGSLSPLNSSLISNYESSLRARKLADRGRPATISGPGGTTIQGVVTQLDFTVATSESGGDNFVQFNLGMVAVGGRNSSLSVSGVG